MRVRVVIVDYQMGNVGSILNMLKHIGHSASVSSDPDEIGAAEKLILPGVGAFDAGMESIRSFGLREILDRKVLREHTPVLGICLGMQLITRGSEEGELPGLGWIAADTVKFRPQAGEQEVRIPHIGWNGVVPRTPAPLFAGLEQGTRAYFVHSYHVHCDDENDVVAWTSYGSRFPSIIGRGHVLGMQFHPEKSHKYGMRLLGNFLAL